MAWSKMKQLLESFLCPALCGSVEYCATSYRYLPDKSGLCYICKQSSKTSNFPPQTIQHFSIE